MADFYAGSSLNLAVSHCSFWAQPFHKVV